MQHGYAYVGNDLQDIYGIDPKTIGKATRMADAYFADDSARQALKKLADQADGVLSPTKPLVIFNCAVVMS